MKFRLKSFGLIEAMISTFIILLFVSAIAFLSVKMVINYKKSVSQSTAQEIAKEFLSRMQILREFDRISFSESQEGQTVPVDCFNSSKSLSCIGLISDNFPLGEYPFGDFIKSGSDEYLQINSDFISGEKQKSYGYKLNSQVTEVAEGRKNVEIKIIWEDNGPKSFSTSWFFTNIK